MTTKTTVRAGAAGWKNHNETMKGLAVRTQVLAGRKLTGAPGNHNETLSGLELNTHIKAGRKAAK